MKKAVGYIRRSTDKQEHSLGDQKNAIEKYAEKNCLELIRVYQDDAISGTSTNGRAGFNEMISVANNGNRDFGIILVWDIKRFSRGDSDEAGYYRHQLRQNGVEVIYISENLRGDDSDDLVLGTKQWLARQESKDKSRDSIRGMLSRICKGLSSSGHPYAYYRQIINKNGDIIQICKRGEKSRAINDEYTKLIPGDIQEIKVVRRIFDLFANKGMGKRLIAKELNKDKIPSPRGKQWGLCAMDYILSNPIYIGNLAYNRTSKAKFHRIINTGKGFEAQYKGKVAKVKTERYRNREQWIIIENAVEGIISKQLFEKVQALRLQRVKDKSFSGKATTSNYMWTGLLKCKYCGKAMCGRNVKTKYGRVYFYACYQCEEGGQHKRCSVSMMELDAALLTRIKERFFNSDRLNSTLKAIKSKLIEHGQGAKVAHEDIEKKLKDNEINIDKLLDNIDSRHKELINSKLDELSAERKQLITQKENAGKEKVSFNTDELLKDILACADDFEEVLKHGSPSERKQYVRSYIGQILIDSDNKHAKVGFYPLPRIPATEPIFNAVCTSSGATTRPI
ncbi:MAG: recombinase family protein [Candidatus Omnitrophota bacterium]